MTHDPGNNGSAPDLGERMAQVSLLPKHDRLRVALADEMAGQAEDSPARRQWSAAVEEADKVHRMLTDVPVPGTLEQRLLDMKLPPPVLPLWQRPIGELLTPRVLAAAASLLLVVAAVWWGYRTLEAAAQARQIRQLATDAANVHTAALRAAPVESISTTDPNLATQWLREHVKFPASVLSGPAARLQGAGVVHLGAATAALTLWEEAGHRYSLLEFVPAEVGLRADFQSPQCSASAGTPASTYEVMLWSEPSYNCGWALVMDPGAPVPFAAAHCAP